MSPSEAAAQDWPNAPGFGASAAPDPRPVALTITGTLPRYLAGKLYRIGPAHPPIRDTDIGHLFDGLAATHEIAISFSSASPSALPTVTYRCVSSSELVADSIARTGRLPPFTFGGPSETRPSLAAAAAGSAAAALASPFHRPPPPTLPGSANISVTISPSPPAATAAARAHAPDLPAHVPLLLARTDAARMQPIRADSLAPLAPLTLADLDPALASSPLSSAHALTDDDDGTVYNFALDPRPHGPARLGRYTLFALRPAQAWAERVAAFDAPAAYLHSFFLTRRYLVVAVWGGRVRMHGAALPLFRNVAHALADVGPAETAEWVFVEKGSGAVVGRIHSTPFFAFHAINSWDEDVPSENGELKVRVTADIPIYSSTDPISRFYYANLLAPRARTGRADRSQWARFTFEFSPAVPPSSGPAAADSLVPPLLSGAVVAPETVALSFDLPTINPGFQSRPARFVYGALDRGRSTFLDGLCKFDTHSRAAAAVWERAGHTPTEPFFVPDPAGEAEDDGTVVSVVLDGSAGESYVLFLDGRTFTEVARATVGGGEEGARRVMPFTFHGLFMPEQVGQAGCG